MAAGCVDMWTVIGESETRDAHRDMDGSHAYLLLAQDDGTMVSSPDSLLCSLFKYY